MIEFIKTTLETNIIASGGLILTCFGSILGLFYKIFPIIWNFIKRKFIVTLDIPSYDDTFDWFNKWLSTLDYSKHTKLLTVSSRYLDNADYSKPTLFFSPAPGNHIFWYKNRLIWIKREREKINNSNKGSFLLYEQFTVIMVGRNKNILKEMIIDARDYNYELEKGKTKIYTNINWDWKKIDIQSPRKIDTVILKNNLQYNILKDVETFFKSEKKYNKLGIPYHRGYLLYGSPGTGKTSIVKAVAGELNIPIYIISISKDLKETQFNSLISNVPQKSIIVIEDIDCLFDNKREMKRDYEITFKTLLNIIDGIISPYGTILFLTTNKKIKLDKSLIRPGRIDKEYKIDKVDKKQALDLFKLFYPNSNGEAIKFSEEIECNKYTPAELQRYFLMNLNEKDALQNIKKLKK